MKEIIKKLLNKLVDILSLPFEYVYSLIKNADNVMYIAIRLLLLITILCGILYIYLAKPYRKLMSDFYFEKYNNSKEARTALLKQFPLENNSTKIYVDYLKKIGAKCSKKGNNYTCKYKQNLIIKSYTWTANIKQNKEGKKSLNLIRKDTGKSVKNNIKEKVKETKDKK